MRRYSTEESAAQSRARPRGRLAIDAGVRHLQTRIQDALAHPFSQPIDLTRVVGSAGITRAVAHLTLLVVGPRRTDGHPIELAVARVREVCPHVGIFLVTDGEPAAHHSLAAYTRAGIDEVVDIADQPLLRRFARLVQARLEAPAPEAALWRVTELTQSSLFAVPQWCVRNSYRRRRTEEIASRFGVDRTTLQRRCTGECGASPNELMRLGRLLHFEELRRTTRLTRQQVVIRLGMESPSAISMLKARLLHSLPSQWQALLRC
ncbi:MAG: helix-turn-helix domain-containing protein [Gemmatimonadaceae bacterium]